MLRNAFLGATAVALLVAVGATAVTAGFAPQATAPKHYGPAPTIKPAYEKGAMLKNCLGNQGECTLVVN